MRYCILIISLGFVLLSFGQVSFDSIRLKIDSTGIDSVFFKYTSSLGRHYTINSTSGPSTTCYTSRRMWMRFKGNPSSIVTILDTAFAIDLGNIALPGYFGLSLVWDTVYPPTLPPIPFVVMDQFIYDDPCQITSVNESQEDKFSLELYPNPTTEFFTLQVDQAIRLKSVDILDVSGKLVHSVEGQTENIDVSTLSDGIYFVRVNTNQGTKVKKLLLAR